MKASHLPAIGPHHLQKVLVRPRSFIALNWPSIYPATKESAAAGGMVILPKDEAVLLPYFLSLAMAAFNFLK